MFCRRFVYILKRFTKLWQKSLKCKCNSHLKQLNLIEISCRLICGDVESKFDAIFDKVRNLHKKSNFSFLICVGNFFSDNDDGSLDKYKALEKQIPIPTYILGPNSEAQEKIYEKYEIREESNEICPNLFFLGKRGIYTLAAGFTLAYLSGIEKKGEGEKKGWQYDKSDIVALRNACVKNFSNIDDYRGIDFLLTNEWPSGIEGKDEENSSKLISFLSLNVKPRYHFCGSRNKHFEKAPFRVPALNARSIEPVSRFIALAKVNNAEKSKFLYALNAQPLSTMRLTELMQKSTDEIDCPYIAMDFSGDIKESQEQIQQQFFWSHNDGSNLGKRGRNDGQQQHKRFKPAVEAGEKCWFCLQSPDLEKHLIICVGEHFYLALAKGPVNNFHTLIIPIEHVQSAALFNEDQFQELEIFKRSLKKLFDSKNEAVVFFERNYMTSHSNINAVGIPRDLEWQLSETLKDKAEEFSLQFETIPKVDSPKALPERGAYFVVEFPNETLITRTMNKFPINFGRDFVCAETLLNAEDRIDWRNCKIPKNYEIDIVNAFKEKYKPFDFTATEDDDD